MPELKPCPFCGSPAVLWAPEDEFGICIKCVSCGCRTPYCKDRHSVERNVSAVERALVKWNRRVELQ